MEEGERKEVGYGEGAWRLSRCECGPGWGLEQTRERRSTPHLPLDTAGAPCGHLSAGVRAGAS